MQHGSDILFGYPGKLRRVSQAAGKIDLICQFLQHQLIEATLVDYYALAHILHVGYSVLFGLRKAFTREFDGPAR